MCQVPRYSRSRFHQLEPFSIKRDCSLEHVFVEQVFSLFIVIVVISSIPFSPSLSHLQLLIVADIFLIIEVGERSGGRRRG